MSTASAPEAARGWNWIICPIVNFKDYMDFMNIVNSYLPHMQGHGSLGHMGCSTLLPGCTMLIILINQWKVLPPGIWCTERAGCWSHPAKRKQIQFWGQLTSTTACLSSQRKRKTKGTCVAPLWVWLPWKKLDPKVTMWKASAILATVSWLNAQSWWWRPWPWPWPWITDLLKTHLDHESVVGEIWNIVARLPDVHRHIRLPDHHDDDKDAKDDNDNNGDDKGDTLRVFY